MLKCQWCNTKDRDEKVKDKKGYYHKKCFDEFLEYKKFKEKEKQDFALLLETICKIHRIDLIPNQFYPFLQEIRNGSVLFGKVKKSYKEGIEYNIIKQTYEYCQDNINWAKNNKEFKDTLQELKYGLAIIKNNINKIVQREKKKNEEQRRKIKTENIDELDESNIKYNNKKNKYDISDFID